MSDIKSMDVSTVISSLASGQIKVNDLALAYGKTDRTIQKYIKSLGYTWSAKLKKHLPAGESYDVANDSKLFAEIVESYSTVDNEKSTKTVNSTVKHKKATNNSTIEKEKAIDNSTADSIDMILFGKSIESQRVQRAYYIDKDVASVIDTVDNKQKSNLVNECLRRVFKEKGLL